MSEYIKSNLEVTSKTICRGLSRFCYNLKMGVSAHLDTFAILRSVAYENINLLSFRQDRFDIKQRYKFIE